MWKMCIKFKKKIRLSTNLSCCQGPCLGYQSCADAGIQGPHLEFSWGPRATLQPG